MTTKCVKWLGKRLRQEVETTSVNPRLRSPIQNHDGVFGSAAGANYPPPRASLPERPPFPCYDVPKARGKGCWPNPQTLTLLELILVSKVVFVTAAMKSRDETAIKLRVRCIKSWAVYAFQHQVD